jgi:hypothetical protein
VTGLLIVLNDPAELDPLLKAFVGAEVRGCTIFPSEGMTRHVLNKDDDLSHYPDLREVVKKASPDSKTLLLVGNDQEIKRIVKLTLEVIGDIQKPDTGFIMTFPVGEVYGLNKRL